MTALDNILAILTGAKVKEGDLWRVYDANGDELANASGVLIQGAHGFLLNTQSAQQMLASLGAAPLKRLKQKGDEEQPEIIEAIGSSVVSRLQSEFLSESLAQDLINRARKRKSRAEEEALLLLI